MPRTPDDHWSVPLADALSELGLDDPRLRDVLLDEVKQALEAPERSARPDVRLVASGDEADLLHLPAPQPTDRGVHVRVHPPAVYDDLAPDLTTGHIRLPADPDVWQTVAHGARPASYRVHCDDGELHLAVDGDLVARLEAGQSTDVEGAVIRVRACGEDIALGRFLRL